MKSRELKQARQHKDWTQEEAAGHLGVTQAYLNLLENGKRRLTPRVVRRAVSVCGLSPDVLPVREDFVPTQTSDNQLEEWLVTLEYPGFPYLKTRTARKNPHEVLLAALGQTSLDSRVAEALPWVAMKYGRPDAWLVETARKFNLQNKLGFVVRLARRAAERHSDGTRSKELGTFAGGAWMLRWSRYRRSIAR
ncbi:MAG TPA: helix-turn-helix transcriptional regulator [Candidatus Acidoferrales bacterium]|nr:helix-turn-helix transcriptional regulator [Candidatus Acidoferrales bacterium]